jgi:hypothetical protein
VLLYGMQSSGASAIAYTLAQRPGCVAFVDIWNMFAAPVLETGADVVAKVVVTTAFPLSMHKARFKPDVTILVLRHPFDNYNSLITKSYAHEGGLILEKFRLLEKKFGEGAEFDHVLYYEDFLFAPSTLIDFCNGIGWTLGRDALSYPRLPEEIQRVNLQHCPEQQGRLKYGLGQFKKNVKRQELVSFRLPAGKVSYLPKLCANLLQHYEERRIARGAMWHVAARPVLSCALDRFIDLALGLSDSGQVCIRAEARGVESGVRIGGLPGAPFHRVTGLVQLRDPQARDMLAVIRVEDGMGNVLAWQSLPLRYGGQAGFELTYWPGTAAPVLYLGGMAQEGGVASAHDALWFENICLEYVPQ